MEIYPIYLKYFLKNLNNIFCNNCFEIGTRTNVTQKYILLSISLLLVIASLLSVTVNASFSGNWNWIYICRQLDPILIPSCSNLVSPNNVLTSEGKRAMVCIQNGITRAGGSTFLLELSDFAIVEILKYLSEPKGCIGIIEWKYIEWAYIDSANGLKEIISVFS